MSTPGLFGARLAMWWAGALTRTAPPDAGTDRLAEIRADVHDHMMAGRAQQLPPGVLSRQVAGRVLRGMSADIAWRLEIEWRPGRLRWHLRHPGTILAWFFLLLAPLGQLADQAHPALKGCADLVSLCLLGFVLAAAGWRLRTRRPAPEDAPVPPLVSLPGLRRTAMTLMSISYAIAGLWRFSPGPLGHVAAYAWAAFGACLLAYLAAMITGGARWALSR
jgi:hypothetical protein